MEMEPIHFYAVRLTKTDKKEKTNGLPFSVHGPLILLAAVRPAKTSTLCWQQYFGHELLLFVYFAYFTSTSNPTRRRLYRLVITQTTKTLRLPRLAQHHFRPPSHPITPQPQYTELNSLYIVTAWQRKSLKKKKIYQA